MCWLRGQVKSGFCQVSVRAACDSAVLMSARSTRFPGTLLSSMPTFLHILCGSARRSLLALIFVLCNIFLQAIFGGVLVLYIPECLSFCRVHDS